MKSTIKWNHIMDCRPEEGRTIIQIDAPYRGSCTMGMRKDFIAPKMAWEEYTKKNDEQGWPQPNFWWVYAEDFPFPDYVIDHMGDMHDVLKITAEDFSYWKITRENV